MTDDASNYVRMFNQFFNKGMMTATYKPIFLRSLLDLGEYHIDGSNSKLPGAEKWIKVDGDTITLDLNFIASRFIKYCWDLEHSFKLKQASNPTSAAIITAINSKLAKKNGKNPPSIDDIIDDKHNELRKNVIQLCIKKQVLGYLITDMPNLYDDKKKKSNKIELKASLIPFLRKHRTVIRNGLNYKLSLFLEKINPSTPRIAMKVDSENYPPRKLVTVSETLLDSEQGHRCFYCDKKYTMPKHRHIDHVIPFNYIFSTDEYNCVAACIKCNLTKTDLLPQKDLFCNVIDRNDKFTAKKNKFTGSMRRSFSMYDKEWYVRTYDNCEADYHGDSLFFAPTPYSA